MRSDAHPLDVKGRRSAQAAVPMALAGSLALLMCPSPALGAESSRSVDSAHPVLGALDGSRPSPAAAEPTTVPASAGVEGSHIVEPGDTVSTISARHGLRTADVLAINGLSWSSVIQPGQVLILAASAENAAPPVTPPAAPAAGGAHVVQGGDTISSVAQQHGLSIDAVLAANGLGWSSIIYPGQTLIIPGAGGATPSADPPAESTSPPPATASPAGAYTVAAGDTITSIAHGHGLSVDAVLAANGFDRASIIYPGQTIVIPEAETVPLVAGTSPAASAPSELDGDQVANAQVIIRVGRELGVTDRGIAIALGTAMQESSLLNLDGGDRDSVGLFQQRPSAGWGTPEEVSDPERAARVFYGGPSDPNASLTTGLLDVPGWESMSFADAAQAVQISAYPERYALWEQPAYAWLAAHG